MNSTFKTLYHFLGNLKDMFANISHVGSDLTWFGSSAAPSIAISGMTVAA